MNSRSVAIALAVGLLAGAVATYAVAGPSLSRTTTVTSVSTKTTTVTIDTVQEVRNAYAAYLQSVRSGNVSAIVAKYATNATLQYYVASPLGMGGGAVGAAQIRQFYDQNILFMHPTVNFANATYAVSILGNESEAIVHSNLTVYGNDGYVTPPNNATGFYVENTVLYIVFVHLGSDWLIYHEGWNEVNAVAGCPSFSSPGCTTLLSTPNWVKQIWPPGQ